MNCAYKDSAPHPLCLNMDESSLPLVPTPPVGTVRRTCKAAAAASLAARRTRVTFMATVIDDSTLQQHMPQVILTNERLFGRHPPFRIRGNVRVWTGRTAWVTAASMRRWLSLLRVCLNERAVVGRPVLLFLDQAPAHLSESEHAKRCKIRLLFIPRGLTWLLQPADVALFSRFKHHLRMLCCRRQVASDRGQLRPLEWLHVVCDSIAAVLPSVAWRRIFATGRHSEPAARSRS